MTNRLCVATRGLRRGLKLWCFINRNFSVLGELGAQPRISEKCIGPLEASLLNSYLLKECHSVDNGLCRQRGLVGVSPSRSLHLVSRVTVHWNREFQSVAGVETKGKTDTRSKGKQAKGGIIDKSPVKSKPSKPQHEISMGTPVEIFRGMTVGELARRLGQEVDLVEAELASLGEPVGSSSQVLSIDAAELVTLEFGRAVQRNRSADVSAVNGTQKVRPAVITVMGHVDHGKTSLLDALRQTSLAAKEAGGITQHLGAFVVSMASGASLTFLDTPGHAAFSAMRARGAAMTDIVVLVVAADDGVMPQTLEAMSHALSAKVPIVVAINKCDKPEANPERVRQQLASESLELEDIGGDVQVVEISATKRTGLDQLEEALLLQAELMDLKSSSEGDVHAVVVEARIDRGQGPLATAIVREGTLFPGQNIVVGRQWGRIRALRDMVGRQLPSAGPSTPVEIDGLRGLPEAGDEVLVVCNEERARRLSHERYMCMERDRLSRISCKPKVEDDPDCTETDKEKSEKVEMVVVVKADVQGSAQAVSQALESLSSPQVAVNIVHTGLGPVSQSDVDLAEACGACVVGFNVRAMGAAVESAAKRAKILVRHHRIIYHLLEDIGKMIVGMAPGTKETQVAGQAEVLSVFEIKGKGRECRGAAKIAGCRVVDGRIMRNSKLRVLRSGELLFEGSCASLRREKLDVDTVGKGTECGIILTDWMDFQVGDVIHCLEDIRRMPKFVSSQSGAVHIEC